MRLRIKIKGFEVRTITSVESVEIWPDDEANPDKLTLTIDTLPAFAGGEILVIMEREDEDELSPEDA